MAVERLLRSQRLFSAASITGNSASAGMPARRRRVGGVQQGMSSDCRSTPGIDATFFAAPVAFENENRVNEVVDRQRRLAHQAAGKSSRRIRRMRALDQRPEAVISNLAIRNYGFSFAVELFALTSVRMTRRWHAPSPRSLPERVS